MFEVNLTLFTSCHEMKNEMASGHSHTINTLTVVLINTWNFNCRVVQDRQRRMPAAVKVSFITIRASAPLQGL